MTNDELKRLQAECNHDGIIRAWHFADGHAAYFWSCENCGHRFVPLDLDMERDAKRYRWLRDTSTVTWRSIQENWRMQSAQCDATIDAEMLLT